MYDKEYEELHRLDKLLDNKITKLLKEIGYTTLANNILSYIPVSNSQYSNYVKEKLQGLLD